MAASEVKFFSSNKEILDFLDDLEIDFEEPEISADSGAQLLLFLILGVWSKMRS